MSGRHTRSASTRKAGQPQEEGSGSKDSDVPLPDFGQSGNVEENAPNNNNNGNVANLNDNNGRGVFPDLTEASQTIQRLQIEDLKREIEKLKEKLTDEDRHSQPHSIASSDNDKPSPGPYGPYEKSEKLPDPPIFEGKGSHDEFYTWKRRVEMKLSINNDRFSTNESQVAYIYSRCGPDPGKLIEPYLDDMTCKQILSQLELCYGDPFRKQTARRKYKELRQGGKSFQEFISEFHEKLQLSGSRATMLEEDIILDIREKLSLEMKQQCLHINVDTAAEFISKLQFIDKNLQDFRTQKERTAKFRNNFGKNKTPAGTLPGSSSDKPTSGGGFPRADTSGQQRPKFSASDIICFNCGVKGHYASACPSKQANAPEQGNA